jgi:selenide,water dikinase
VAGVFEPLLANPQTSGGLLVAVSGEKSDGLVERLRSAGYDDAARIGRVAEGTGILLE